MFSIFSILPLHKCPLARFCNVKNNFAINAIYSNFHHFHQRMGNSSLSINRFGCFSYIVLFHLFPSSFIFSFLFPFNAFFSKYRTRHCHQTDTLFFSEIDFLFLIPFIFLFSFSPSSSSSSSLK